MNVTLAHDSSSYKKFNVSLTVQEGKRYFESAAKVLSQAHPIKGFRPGQAPIDVVLNVLPAQQVYQEVASQAASKLVPEIIRKEQVKRLGDPLIEFKELKFGEPLELDVSLALWPVITLPDYKTISVNQEKSEVSDKDVEEALDYLKNMRKVQTIDDAFAKSLGNFANLEALKASIREGIVHDKTVMQQEKSRAHLLENIRKQTEIELAPFIIEREAQKIIESELQQLQQAGMEFQDYLKKLGKSEKEFVEQAKELAKSRLENALIINEIAKKEAIQIEESEIAQRINQMLSRFASVKEAQKHIDPHTLQARVHQQLIEEKVFSQILDKQIILM